MSSSDEESNGSFESQELHESTGSSESTESFGSTNTEDSDESNWSPESQESHESDESQQSPPASQPPSPNLVDTLEPLLDVFQEHSIVARAFFAENYPTALNLFAQLESQANHLRELCLDYRREERLLLEQQQQQASSTQGSSSEILIGPQDQSNLEMPFQPGTSTGGETGHAGQTPSTSGGGRKRKSGDGSVSNQVRITRFRGRREDDEPDTPPGSSPDD